MRMQSKRAVRLSDQLRQIIESWPESRYRIAADTGITESMLSRFMSGSRGLSMESLDTLGEYLGLEIRICPTTSKRQKGN